MIFRMARDWMTEQLSLQVWWSVLESQGALKCLLVLMMGGGTRLFCKASPKLHAMWLLWSGCDTSKHLYWQLSQAFILCLLSFWPWNDAAKLMICFSSEILTLLTYWCYEWLHLHDHCSDNTWSRSVLCFLWDNARCTPPWNLTIVKEVASSAPPLNWGAPRSKGIPRLDCFD